MGTDSILGVGRTGCALGAIGSGAGFLIKGAGTHEQKKRIFLAVTYFLNCDPFYALIGNIKGLFNIENQHE